MKKSNKVSVFYILSSISLLLVLVFGGIYGIYVSVGLNFVRSSVSNVADTANNFASNVSYGGTVNFESSMTGVIILSIILIVLAVLDFISLIKQITLFKQFKMVRESKFEQEIESKVKSKSSIIFFAVLIDLISIAVGVAGVFVNMRSFVGNNISWVLYVIDGFVSLLALVSLVLLIFKLKGRKKDESNIHYQSASKSKSNNGVDENSHENEYKIGKIDVDEIEYKLIKLKNLKNNKMISADEYKKLHDHLLGISKENQSEK